MKLTHGYLIAFDDRPEHRLKDLDDIAFITSNYIDLVSDDWYEEYVHLLEAEVPLLVIGARILGQHLRPLLARLETLHQRILSVLTGQMQLGENSPLARRFQLLQGVSVAPDLALQQIHALRQGILGEPADKN